jgi:hypothetical protein
VVDRGPIAGLVLAAALLALMLTAVLLTGCGSAPVAEGAGTTTTTAPPEVVVPIPNTACLTCHTDFAQKTAKEDKLVFSHDLHLQQRITCVTCHAAVGHEGTQLPSQSTCDACHGLPMPHPDIWDKTHGKTVDAQGTKTCAGCHNVYVWCEQCHGVQMPHPAGWQKTHGTVARPQLETCRTCHQPDFCLQCHPVQMPHPSNWTANHGADVQAKGSSVCQSCHKPDFCSSCHGMPMPHPADWGTTHQDMAKKKPGECVLCHDQKDCDACHQIHQTHTQGGGS